MICLYLYNKQLINWIKAFPIRCFFVTVFFPNTLEDGRQKRTGSSYYKKSSILSLSILRSKKNQWRVILFSLMCVFIYIEISDSRWEVEHKMCKLLQLIPAPFNMECNSHYSGNKSQLNQIFPTFLVRCLEILHDA